MNHKALKKVTALLIGAAMAFALPFSAAGAYNYNPADAYADFVSGSSPDIGSSGEVSAPLDLGRNVTVPADSLTVYSYQTSINAGDTFKIGVRFTPADSDDYVTYLSSDTSVVSVDASGLVMGKKAGSAVISVTTSGGLRERFTVYVQGSTSEVGDPLQNYIELEKSSVELVVGDSYSILYSVSLPEDYGTVTFRSLKKSVATVSETGIVTAVGPGTTRIVCTTASGVYAALDVTVVEPVDSGKIDQEIEESLTTEYDEDGNVIPSKVRFVDESAAVKAGEKIKLKFQVYPSGSKYSYKFTSSNTNIAKVSKSGTVLGVSAGTAVITIMTDNGKEANILVTVYDDAVKGIDVSKHNGDIDWETVKNSGEVQFVMIRASFGYEDEDIKLRRNVKMCEKYGIPYGFYHYTYATSVAEAKKEAAFFLNVISEYHPTYPIVLDIEESKIYDNLSRDENTAIVRTFMKAFEKAGYYAMIYSFARFFESSVFMGDLVDYDIWVACWGDEERLAQTYSYGYGMWQYSETGIMDGIPGYVDLDYSYVDYPAIIQKAHLNGF